MWLKVPGKPSKWNLISDHSVGQKLNLRKAPRGKQELLSLILNFNLNHCG